VGGCGWLVRFQKEYKQALQLADVLGLVSDGFAIEQADFPFLSLKPPLQSYLHKVLNSNCSLLPGRICHKSGVNSTLFGYQ